MSDDYFPSLPGLDPKVVRTPIWSTQVQIYPASKEFRTARWSECRYRYELTFNFLRQYTDTDEAKTLTDFIAKHRGRFESFQYCDPYSGSAVRVRFDSDAQDLERIFSQIWQTASLSMITVLGESGGGGGMS